MNIEEIYVLNRAIDGKDIFSFPSFSKLKISDFLVDPIKDGLIRKGILENYGKFTNEGIVIIKRLKLFKEAKKRIRINNVSIGILNEKESVLILYNPLYDEYKILMSDTSNNVTQLLESYEFLQNPGIETEQLYEEEEVSLPQSDFSKRYVLQSGSYFRLTSESHEKNFDEIYFYDNRKFLIYDCNSGTLRTKRIEQIIDQLSERMSVS